VKYSDPAVTPIAVTGLDGMDMDGGKFLSARMAAVIGTIPEGGSGGGTVATQEFPNGTAQPSGSAAASSPSKAAPTSNIV